MSRQRNKHTFVSNDFPGHEAKAVKWILPPPPPTIPKNDIFSEKKKRDKKFQGKTKSLHHGGEVNRREWTHKSATAQAKSSNLGCDWGSILKKRPCPCPDSALASVHVQAGSFADPLAHGHWPVQNQVKDMFFFSESTPSRNQVT